MLVYCFFFFLRCFLFLERGERRERNIEALEKHRSVTSLVPPSGDLAYSPGMCPDWELNQQPLDPQAGAQSTEPDTSQGCILLLKWTIEFHETFPYAYLLPVYLHNTLLKFPFFLAPAGITQWVEHWPGN